MEGQLITAIIALAASLQGGTVWLIKYMADQIEKRDQRIEQLSTSTEKLAALVPDLIAENQRLRRGRSGSS